MTTVAEIAPAFAAEITATLAVEAQSELAVHLCSADIERCTYDPTVNAGYIYMERQMSPLVSRLRRQPALVAGTFTFGHPHWFNIDVDHEGYPCGIELLSRPDVIALLRSANVL